MQTLAPVQSSDRIVFMDVLRGFAILGIFIANLGTGFTWYNESANATGPLLLPKADHIMSFLHHMFIEGKFYSIFSLLLAGALLCNLKEPRQKASMLFQQ